MTQARVHWDDNLDALARPEEALSSLLARVPGATVFNTWEWMSAAATAVPADRRLQVLRVEENGELAAFIPLTRGPETLHGLPASTLRLLGAPFSDRVVLLVDPAAPGLWNLVLDALVDGPAGWDTFVLSELAEEENARAALEAWSVRRGIRLHWRHCARSPVLALDFADERALRASQSRALSTRLRRSRKRLEQAGRVEFQRFLPAPDEVDAHLEECQRVEMASWKGGAGVGIFQPGERYRFFREASVRLAGRGWLDIGTLRLDGRLISYRYGFRYRGAFLDYNLAFDPEFAALGPGRVLLDDMIVSSLACGLRSVDASRGSLRVAHQLVDWTSAHLDHHELWILNNSLIGRYLDLLRNRVRPGIRRLRRHG